jgi:hypothetical protein
MQHTAAAQYRSTATEVRAMAQLAITPEIRAELLTLAEQFELLAERSEANAAATVA